MQDCSAPWSMWQPTGRLPETWTRRDASTAARVGPIGSLDPTLNCCVETAPTLPALSICPHREGVLADWEARVGHTRRARGPRAAVDLALVGRAGAAADHVNVPWLIGVAPSGPPVTVGAVGELVSSTQLIVAAGDWVPAGSTCLTDSVCSPSLSAAGT